MSRLPDVLRFIASPTGYLGRSAIEVPAEVADKIQSMQAVEGTVEGHPFRAKVTRDNERTFICLSAAIEKRVAARNDNRVSIAILGPEGDVIVPSDFQKELDVVVEASATWISLTDQNRRDWVRWIEGAKQRTTRERRITRAIEQLQEGGRRACCVNVNEFMLCRIADDDKEKIKHPL